VRGGHHPPPPPPHDLLDHGPPDHKGRDTRVSA
jgi:hypothetical protein